jgi:3D (Asp-Asp-Asp) domain-containing protein
MKRTSACLAALALGLAATQAPAQVPLGTPGDTPPSSPAEQADPIADLIAKSAGLSRGVMAPIPDEATSLSPPAVDSAPDWTMKVTLYHSGGGGAGARDSLGCNVVAMRTAAIDPAVAPRRTILFIPDTVGLPMPDGSTHDGYWYASDTGGAIKGHTVDLFTGRGRGSMQPLMKINTRKVAVQKAGTFTGCPRAGSRIATR